MATFIYNCKKCKTGKRIDYPLSRDGRYYRLVDGAEVPAGVWVSCWRMNGDREYSGDLEGVCSGCGEGMTFAKLQGYLNESHKCDARCTGARGHICDCSCGGANHGKVWA